MEDVQELKSRLAKLNTANRPFYEQCQLVCPLPPYPANPNFECPKYFRDIDNIILIWY